MVCSRAGLHHTMISAVRTSTRKKSIFMRVFLFSHLMGSKSTTGCAAFRGPFSFRTLPAHKRRLSESPRLSDRRQSLKVILILDPALHPELGQERHHLSDRDSRKLGSSTKRSID